MTATDSTARTRILVAIDIAKAKHEVLGDMKVVSKIIVFFAVLFTAQVSRGLAGSFGCLQSARRGFQRLTALCDRPQKTETRRQQYQAEGQSVPKTDDVTIIPVE